MKQKKTGLARLFEFAGKYRILSIFSCIFSAVSAVLMLAPFVCIWLVIQEVFRSAPDFTPESIHIMNTYGWAALGFAVAGLVVYLVALLCSHTAAFYTAKQMKSSVLHHFSTVPIGFFTLHPSGKLRKVIDEDSVSTESFLAHQLPDIIGTVVTLISMLVLLMLFDWRLGLLSLLPLILGFVLQGYMMSHSSIEFMKHYQTSLEEMNHNAVEYVRGIPVVKVFQQTIYSFRNFHKSIIEYKDYATKYCLSWQNPMTIFTGLVNGAFLFLIPAGILLLGSTQDVPTFVLNWIFYILFTPACAVMITKIMYSSEYKLLAEEAIRRIDSLLDEEPLPVLHPTEHTKDASVSFENVTFAYTGTQTTALKNISFHIPQGSTTALVGPSGGGKSTAANLIPRFWDVQEGCIKIGGADIRHIPQQDLMRQIAFVFQDSHLFKASILQNICAAKPNATREEALKAAHAAQCDDILEKMPNGIDTVIGTKGIYLSGGEQQRIALARAILKDAPIVILDEATAFADPENEYRIQQAFEHLTNGKTVLIIAHRLSTIQNADAIYVINQGEIAEHGTHASLLEQKGLYASMWENYQSAAVWGVGKEIEHVS